MLDNLFNGEKKLEDMWFDRGMLKSQCRQRYEKN